MTYSFQYFLMARPKAAIIWGIKASIRLCSTSAFRVASSPCSADYVARVSQNPARASGARDVSDPLLPGIFTMMRSFGERLGSEPLRQGTWRLLPRRRRHSRTAQSLLLRPSIVRTTTRRPGPFASVRKAQVFLLTIH